MNNSSIYGVYFDEHGKVLLIKDANSHLWGFPGGHVEAGETDIDALRREFLEETGLEILGEPTYITEQRDAFKQRYFYHVADVKGHASINGNGGDTDHASFFNTSELPAGNMAPGIAIILDRCK